MNKKANPVIIAIAVIALIGFCYFMYQQSNPSVQSAYDPTKVGPPGYARNHGAGADMQKNHP